jgi:hypothetical protein
VCIIIKQTWSNDELIIISMLALRGFQRSCYYRCDHLRGASGMDKQLLPRELGCCPEEALLLLFLLPPCKNVTDWSCPSWIPKWLQGEWLRAKTDKKMETKMPAFSPTFS